MSTLYKPNFNFQGLNPDFWNLESSFAISRRQSYFAETLSIMIFMDQDRRVDIAYWLFIVFE